MRLSPFFRDWLERLFWTAIEAFLGVLIVAVGEIDAEWLVVIIPILMGAKGLAARQIGDSDTAAIGSD